MGRVWADFRFALRGFARTPVFTLVVLSSLALGIGANTAIFTLVDQLILRLLPVKAPEQLVMIWSSGPNLGDNRGTRMSSYPMYQEFQRRGTAFQSVFCRFETPLAVSSADRTERVNGELVSGNFFQALGVGPSVGRVFSPEQDDRVYKGHPVVVLSHNYWVNRFAADRKVIGQTMQVNGYPMTIVGVAAAGFHGIDPASEPDLRIPIQMKPLLTPGWDHLGNRRSQWIQVFARMRPGYTVDSAKASLQPVFHSVLEDDLRQPEMRDVTPFLRGRFLARQVRMERAATGFSQLRRNYETALVVLMCMVGLVLLIACFNVANLLVARAVARQKEIAVRLAVGASRGQLLRQLLLESLLLSLTGGALGLLLSSVIIEGLVSFLPQDGGPLMLSTKPDPRILVFGFCLTLLTTLLFGVAPALNALRLDLWSTLKDVVGAVSGVSGSVKMRKVLVTGQVALSFLLLAGAGLFVKTLANLKSTDPGFRSLDTLLSFQVNPALNGYKGARLTAYYRDALARIRALPGVQSASIARVALLRGHEWDSTMSVEGHRAADGEDMQAFMNSVSPGYFDNMGVRLLEGRDFDTRDVGEKATVAIVNRRFATHFFGKSSAVGRHIGFGDGPGTKLNIEIVGVVDDSLYEGPREGVHRQVFIALDQGSFPTGAAFYVRAAGDPRNLLGSLRQTMASIDGAVPVYYLKTLARQMDETLGTERMIATISTAFAVLAVLLAAIGLYGVMAFVVARRTKEIGLRMALGAQPGTVRWMVMRESLVLLSSGVVVGAVLSYLLSRYLESQLYGVKPSDGGSAVIALVLLAAVTGAAAFLPARRASSIDPIEALRYE